MNKIRLECNCKTCKANAAKIGATAPLAALAPAHLVAAAKGKAHGIVFSAHDPSAVGVATRKATGIEAA